MSLPVALVRWAEPAYPSSGVWDHYNVYRTLPGETAVRIATITAHGQVSYYDYTAPSRRAVTYNITQVVLLNGSYVESAAATATSTLNFQNAFLHNVADPNSYVQLREETISIAIHGAIEYFQVAGRRAPVALVGEAWWAQIQITDTPRELTHPLRYDLQKLCKQQLESAAIFCLRLGYSGDRFFVIFADGISLADDLAFYKASINLTQIDYDDSV